MSLNERALSTWTWALANIPTSSAGVLPWIESHLREFFPFEQVILAHGELAAGEINITHTMSSGFDEDYVKRIPD